METLEQLQHTWSQVIERFCADGRPLVRTTTAVLEWLGMHGRIAQP